VIFSRVRGDAWKAGNYSPTAGGSILLRFGSLRDCVRHDRCGLSVFRQRGEWVAAKLGLVEFYPTKNAAATTINHSSVFKLNWGRRMGAISSGR